MSAGADALAGFRHCALQLLRSQAPIRSVMLAVGQYADENTDETVHALIVGSPRDTPVWPHVCAVGWREDHGEQVDLCNFCGLFHWVQNVRSVVLDAHAFERFCHEHGNVEHADSESYLPYAIARLDGDELAIEIVGKLRRPQQAMIPDEPEEHPWLALPRSRALYELVCASPADDAPRRVLADYLLEHEHPRGEFIALSLARDLDAAGRARRDALLAQYGRQWISPLGAVIPEGGAYWERGFLSRADVFAEGNVEPLRDTPVWGTVETIRFLGGTAMVDPAMAALRDIGPMSSRIGDLARVREWAIERLHVVVDEGDPISMLWNATTLPQLAHLVLQGAALRVALKGPLGVWWQQLVRLSIWLDPGQAMPQFLPLNLPPWVAVSQRSALNDEPGWEIATDAGLQTEISLAGWHEGATQQALIEIIAQQPRGRDVALAPSPYWAPTAADAERIAAAAGRPVCLGPLIPAPRPIAQPPWEPPPGAR